MRALIWIPVILLAACAAPATDLDHVPRPVRELARWDVWSDHGRVGEVVQLEIQDSRGDVSFFHVRNRDGQWLGFVDRQGRVYQRVPFSVTELFRGVYPMAQALALLCEVNGPVVVVSREAGAVAPAPPDPLAQPATAALPEGLGMPPAAPLWSGAGH